MSSTAVHSAPRRPSGLGRRRVVLSAVALVGVIAACSPATPSVPDPSAQFCSFWDRVQASMPAPDNPVVVRTGLVALAETATTSGSRCTDTGAAIRLGEATLAEGQEVLVQEGTAGASFVAVSGSQLAAASPVLDNLSLSTLDATVSARGIEVRGVVSIRLSGVTSAMSFTGTLQDLDNWSVSLSSGAFSVPGITTSPAQFSGVLRSIRGVPSLQLTAAVNSAQVGQVTVRGAEVSLSASPATGVSARVTGELDIGPARVRGTIAVDFDRTGVLLAASADLDLRLQGFQAGGRRVELTGRLQLRGNAVRTEATFVGSGNLGDIQVNQVNASLVVEPNRATLIGLFDITTGSTELRYNGTVLFEGTSVSVLDLTLAAGGEYTGTLANGQIVSVRGVVTVDVIEGQLRTVVTGDFRFGKLRGSGSAVVEIDGNRTVLRVDGAVQLPGLDAEAVTGSIVLDDGAAVAVDLEVMVRRFDLRNVSVTDARLAVNSTAGSDLAIRFTGNVAVVVSGLRLTLAGALDAVVNDDGLVERLDGRLSGLATISGWRFEDLSVDLVANQVVTTATGSLTVRTASFPLVVPLDFRFSAGTGSPDWLVTGSGPVRLASLDVARANLELRPGDDTMRAFNATAKVRVGLIDFNFGVEVRLTPSGGCRELRLSRGDATIRWAAVEILRSQIDNCNVTG